MNEAPRYLSGWNRIWGAFSVCTSCGAMVDNEFLEAHTAFHEDSK